MSASGFQFINGGFEDGLRGWQKVGGELSRVSSPRRSGEAAGLLRSSTSSTKWAYQIVSIRPDLAYEFAGYLRGDAGVSAAHLRISWYGSADGGGRAIATDDSPNRLTSPAGSFEFLTTGAITPPPGAQSARLRILLTPRGSETAGLYMDDFVLTAGPPQQTGAKPSSLTAAPDEEQELLEGPPPMKPSPADASPATLPVASRTPATSAPGVAAVTRPEGRLTSEVASARDVRTTSAPSQEVLPADHRGTDVARLALLLLGGLMFFGSLAGSLAYTHRQTLQAVLVRFWAATYTRLELIRDPGQVPHPPPTGLTPASVIAIDGPVASGKTAVGLSLARDLGYRLVDTGMIYRAVAWLALHQGVDLNDEAAVTRLAENATFDVQQPSAGGGPRIRVDGVDITDELRSPEVDRSVSLVSRLPGVRRAVLELQRNLAAAGKIIMLGRDIGTVVLPDAPLKVYLDASAPERARRRHKERAEAGLERPEVEILHELEQRDEMDRQRHVSPLRPAPDAIVIDTDDLSLEEVIERVRAAAGG